MTVIQGVCQVDDNYGPMFTKMPLFPPISNGVGLAVVGQMRIRMLSPPATDTILAEVFGEIGLDKFRPNQEYDVSPSVAIFLMASGWARLEMRSLSRRQHHEPDQARDRRRLSDRRVPLNVPLFI
jgi:hypothetical protein